MYNFCNPIQKYEDLRCDNYHEKFYIFTVKKKKKNIIMRCYSPKGYIK